MSGRAALFCAALWAGAPVAAQAPGHFAPASRPIVSQHEASVRMGRCALNRNRKVADELVRAVDATVLDRARRRMMPALELCLRGAGSATLDMRSLRGGIAEALVLEDPNTLAAIRARPAVAPVRVADAAEDVAVPAVMACAVAASPVAAADLLDAPAESQEEAAAFRRMLPALQRCVPASGAVRIKPFHVRGLTAIALRRSAAEAAE